MEQFQNKITTFAGNGNVTAVNPGKYASTGLKKGKS